MTSTVRVLTAPNPGPFTLAGTNTYLVGRDDVAVIDPGPDVASHLHEIEAAVRGADSVTLLLTHDHGDHVGGASALAARLGVHARGPGGVVALGEGDRFATDAGVLIALSTPGHTEVHFSFLLEPERAVFVGDLLLGQGDTTWIGEYRGGVADYLASLDRLDEIGPALVYPGHGEVIHDPAQRIQRFRTHRLDRIDQVRLALRASPEATPRDLARAVYPDLPPSLEAAALSSIEVILDYLGRGE